MTAGRTLLYAMTTAMLLSEGVYDLVFALMAYGVSGRATSVATTYAIGYGAEILVTIIGAGFLDHFDRKKLFVGAQLSLIALFCTAFVIARSNGLSERTIWLFAFVADLIHHYARLALFTLIPTLFARETLAEIQGTRAVIAGIARVLAPLGGAAVISLVGLSRSLAAVIALQVVAALLAVGLRGGARVVARAERARIAEAALGTVRALRAIAIDPAWRRLTLLNASSHLVIAIATLLFVPLLRAVHHVAEANAGRFLSCGALGMVASGLLLKRLRARIPQHVLPCALLVAATGLTLMVSPAGPTLLVVATLVVYVGLALFLRTSEVVLQEKLPEERFASWYGAMDAVDRVLALAGVLCAGRIFDRVGGPSFYAALVVLMLVLAVLWSRRTLRAHHARTPALCRNAGVSLGAERS